MESIYQAEMVMMKDPEQETSKQSAWYVNVKTAIATQKVAPFDIKPAVIHIFFFAYDCYILNLYILFLKTLPIFSLVLN